MDGDAEVHTPQENVVAVEPHERLPEEEEQPARKLRRATEGADEGVTVATMAWMHLTGKDTEVETNGDVYRCSRCTTYYGKNIGVVKRHQLHCKPAVKQEFALQAVQTVKGVPLTAAQWNTFVEWVNEHNMPEFSLENLELTSSAEEAEAMLNMVETDMHSFLCRPTSN